MKPMINKEQHLRALRAVAEAYTDAYFGIIFPLLAEDCVWESQWRLDAERGREQVIRYYARKECAMRNSTSRTRCAIVELIGNLNLSHGSDGHGKPLSFGLYYPEGKLCLYMEQTLDGQVNGILIDLTLNEDGLITRIDLCMPELFRFKRYEE